MCAHYTLGLGRVSCSEESLIRPGLCLGKGIDDHGLPSSCGSHDHRGVTCQHCLIQLDHFVRLDSGEDRTANEGNL